MLSLTKHDVFTNMMSPFVKLRVTFPIIAKDCLQAGTMRQQACPTHKAVQAEAQAARMSLH